MYRWLYIMWQWVYLCHSRLGKMSEANTSSAPPHICSTRGRKLPVHRASRAPSSEIVSLKSLSPGEGGKLLSPWGSCRFKKNNNKFKKKRPRCLFLKHRKHQHLFVTLSMINTEEFVLIVTRRLVNQARLAHCFRSAANTRFPPTFVIRPRRVGEARCAASDGDARQSRGGIWKETENTKSLL